MSEVVEPREAFSYSHDCAGVGSGRQLRLEVGKGMDNRHSFLRQSDVQVACTQKLPLADDACFYSASLRIPQEAVKGSRLRICSSITPCSLHILHL